MVGWYLYMSMLFKGLQETKNENEQRHTTAGGAALHAGRLAGSGVIKVAGSNGINRRTAGVAAAP
jgi:hypothetical protein